MQHINQNTVARLAELAKLEFSEAEANELLQDLNRILAFVNKLQTLDTEALDPLVYMNEEPVILRPDVVVEELTHEEILCNAPKKDSDYFRVPKVLDK
ncbi:MAG: Asp-tRNA(Asn)/Glu-tRNA(Gln) amidotransferase subunit GatC [Flavobacteriales bacterium]|nr:Asp-tRNA(Asn)/Glu-tRNA(Gln) amidotransferase subunit GatC [Flavobacteriales bacterium]MCZ2443075.1 Asp-tRNA(Asn)/Glu-tRNA(Gln) amidotransferase subunit GatC [Flavobacteriales bacterium]